jgi:carbonic anhydrase
MELQSDKYKQIFEMNRKWVEEKTQTDPGYFEKQFKEQHPEFFYIGCSDSRVPASRITGLEIGDLFVHRNIANVVSNNDMNILSAIQFAVEHLEVKHIIVCGHYGCGGVKAALEQKSFGLLDGWLKNVREVYREYYDELESIEDSNKKLRRLIELNEIEQVENVIKTSYVQKSYVGKGFPIVHGWVYDMKNGKLIDLDIDFEDELQIVQKVYKLEKGISKD